MNKGQYKAKGLPFTCLGRYTNGLTGMDRSKFFGSSLIGLLIWY